MKSKKIVAIVLDPDDVDEELALWSFDADGNLSRVESKKSQKSASKVLREFLNTDLPYIKYQDEDPFSLYDPEVKKMHTRIFKVKDAMLERDTDITNALGMKNKKTENVEFLRENFYLPGLPNLIHEEYPLFRPDIYNSHEFSNDEFYDNYVTPFYEILDKNKRDITGSHLIEKMRDLVLYQLPIAYESYFSFDLQEFYETFINTSLEWIVGIYSTFIYKEKDLRKFFKKTDESYKPILSKEPFKSLKPIGSVGESAFPFAISDADTQMLNQMLVHVEIVNLSLGIGEGYELYFDSKKKNFANEKIMGSDSTKLNNFIKRFSKCVAICLNSKTNKFVMTDYYWIGVFEIEDVLDGEVEDVKTLFSRVKLRHFSYYNFENDKKLTIRNILASFFYTKPEKYLETQTKITQLNNKIVKEWISFKKQGPSLLLQNDRSRKRFKKSPFIYRTDNGLSFTKQSVDLDLSLLEFIAIGHQWSCQTLGVDLRKLFTDKQHLNNLDYKVDPKKYKALLSVYDEYYQDADFSLNERHVKLESAKFGNPTVLNNAKAVFEKWESNVRAYNKAKSLQGDVLARVIDYGYLEDKPYNGKEVHFKTDGYYLLYETIGDTNDLVTVDESDSTHYELCKEALQKLHKVGVTFNPSSEPIQDIFKFYKNKVYIINLEDASVSATNSNIRRDLAQLDRIFNKKSDLSYLSSKRRRSSSNNNKSLLHKNTWLPILSSDAFGADDALEFLDEEDNEEEY